MAMLTIGSTALKNPSSYSVTLSDLDSDNTTRSETGILTRDRVRAGIYKIDVGWDLLTKAELKAITDLLSPAQFNVTFYDPTSSSNKTASMYAGDKKGDLVSYLSEGSTSFWSLSVALTQY